MPTKAKRDWKIEEDDELWALGYLRYSDKGTPIYGIVRSVSRRIDFYTIDVSDQRPIWLTPVFRDVLGLSPGKGDHDGLRVDGCGMDMIFHCVYNLGLAIKGDGDFFKSEQL